MNPRFLILALLLLSSTAAAETGAPPTEIAERIVFLKNEAFYRGEILEFEPQKRVTLRLATGEIRRFEWSAIKRVTVAGSGPDVGPKHVEISSSQQTGSPPPSKSSLQEPHDSLPKELDSVEKTFSSVRRFDSIPEKDIVWLQISSSHPDVRLQYLHQQSDIELDGMSPYGVPVSGSIQRWKTACRYPCNDLVARAPTFRIVGDDLVKSKSFTFPKTGKRFSLSVRAGEGPLRRGAYVVLAVGGIASIFGFVPLALAIDGGNFNPVSQASLAFYGMQGGGALLMLLSIPMFVASRTTLTLDSLDRDRAEQSGID